VQRFPWRLRRGLFASVSLLAGVVAVSVGIDVTAVGTATASASVTSHEAKGCASSHVLLLGSYPSEVSENLQRMVLSPNQPTVIKGVDYYAGTLDDHAVVTAIAGPAPSLTYATTVTALQHFSCTSAVVFTGTAGGGGTTQLGDVAVPSKWTSTMGASFSPVSSSALLVAQQIAATASSQLSTSASIDDGPCLCQGIVHSIQVVPLLRTPHVVVGGYGTTYGGNNLTCIANGGMLEGCNPCPPSSGASLTNVTIGLGAISTTQEARAMSVMAANGQLVPGAWSLLAHAPPPSPGVRIPSALASSSNGTSYAADDEQTTGAQQAADAYNVPFIAFRGISDTTAVGNLWPFEYFIYQQLAADNAGTAARLWIDRWDAG
jgi:nucleoside phosphorylase